MALNALAFEIGIKEAKNSELNSIVSRLNQLSGKTVTIDVKGVPELNQLLNRLGHDNNGFTFKLPDLSTFMEQVKSVKNVTESLFSKQNAGDIPAFQSALQQMRELSVAIEKLKNENLSLQTGHSSDIFNRIQKMGTALNSAFSEVPNVNIQSMTGYMKELTAEMLKFQSAMEKKGGMKNFSAEAQTEISRVMRMFDQLYNVGNDSSTLKIFQQQVRAVASIVMESIGNVVSEINAVKKAIQHDNFSAFSERIKKAADAMEILDANFKKFHLTISQDEGMRNFMTGLGEVIRNVRATMSSLNLTGGDTGVSALTNTIKSVERAKYAVYELDKILHNANAAMKVGNEFGGDTTKLREQIELMKRFKAELDIISTTGSFKGMSASDYLNTADFKIAKDILVTLIKEQERWNTEMQKTQGTASSTASAVRQLSNEEERLAQAIRQSINAGQHQSQVLSDLRGMMMQYLSVYGAQQFVKEMANITGELELQQKSLEVIIGSAATAQQLYGQIRDLSQMSPYTFQDLIKSTRQLAAFNIDTPQLYDTMKALTDIGAGLSVDVQRLILAFGHVKAYGYLSGIQNRQFETAGIDLMGELVKYYNNQADEAAKQGKVMERVTRKSLYGRMRKRDIPFEDVQNVILGLDKEGGQFYNMQIRQFETLGGKLRNLRNNYNIMMSEMGKANHGFLTTSVDVINDVTENWRTYYNIIMDVVWGLGAAKVAMLAYNGIMGKQALATYGALMAQVQKESFQRSQVGAVNNMWRYQSPINGKTRYELGSSSYGAKGLLASQVKEIASSKELTATQKMQIALRNNLSKAARAQILASAGVNAATIKEINSMSAYNRTMLRVQLSLRMLAAEMKATMIAMATNPMTWIFAAVTGIMALVSHSQEARQKIDDLATSTGEAARQDASALTDFLDNYKDIYKQSSGGSVSRGGVLFDIDKAAIEAHGVNQVLDAFMEKIQDMSPMYKGDLFDIEKFDKQADQAVEAAKKVAAMETAKNIVGSHQSFLADLNAKTGGWGTAFTDASGERHGEGFWTGALHSQEFGTNAKDYADAISENMTALTNVNKEELRNFFQENEAIFKEMAEKYGLDIVKDRDAIFRRWLKSLPNTGGDDNSFMPKLTFKNGSVAGENTLPKTIWAAFTSEKALREAKQDMEDQVPIIVQGLQNKFNQEIAKLPKDMQSDVFGYALNDWMNKLFEQEKMTDPAAQSQVINSILLNSLGQSSEFDAVINQLILKNLGAKAKEALGAVVDENSQFTDEKVQDALRALTSDLSSQNWLWNQALQNLIKDTPRIFESAFNEALKSKSPYQELWQELAGNKHKLGDTTFNSLIKSCETFTDWVDKSKKKYKELKDEIATNALHIKVKADFQGGSAESFAKYMKEKFGVDVTKDNHIFDFSGFEKSAGISFDEARSHYKNMVAMEGYEAYAKAEGIDLSDKNKNKGGSKSYHDEFAKRWDERIRILKEAYDWYDKWEKKVGHEAAINEVVEKYGDIFDEWRKDPNIKLRMDIDVNNIAEYAQYIDQIRRDALARYKEQRGQKKFNNGEQALRVLRQAESLLTDINYDSLTRASERWASQMAKQLDDLTKRWDIYKTVVETTGDRMLAASLADIGGEHVFRTQADAVRSEIEDVLKQSNILDKITFDTSMSNTQIKDMVTAAMPTINRIDYADDDSYRKALQGYQQQIEGLVNAMEKWREIQITVKNDAITAYAKMVVDSRSLKDKIAKINSEYLTTITHLNTLKKIGKIGQSEYDNRKTQAENQRKVENMEAIVNSTQIDQAFGIVGNVLKGTARELDRQLSAIINGEDFKKLNPSQQQQYIDLQNKVSGASQTATSPFNVGAWGELMTAKETFVKNVAALVESMKRLQQATAEETKAEKDYLNAKTKAEKDDAKRRKEEAAKKKKQAEKDVDENQSNVNQSGQNLKKKSDDAADGLDNFSNALGQLTQGSLSGLVLGIGNLVKVIKGDSDLAKNVGQLFGEAGKSIGGVVGAILQIIDLLGDDPVGFIDGLLNKIASVIEAVISNIPQIIGSVVKGAGNIVASAIDGIGGLFGLDFGLSDLFNPDKGLQEKIEELKAEVTKIENNTALILKARERTLGYDTGKNRQSYSDQYYHQENVDFANKQTGLFGAILKGMRYGRGFNSPAEEAMYNYYQENGDGSGYKQQLANLRSEREKYMEMYNAEYDKKDSSDSALEEYKGKIAELDDQIHYFALDLANELWGIDLKGWAQQLTDALATAFENGTDMAKAYKNAVEDILRSLASKMMQLAIIEPIMERLQAKIFGVKNADGTWTGGIFDIDNPEKSAKQVTNVISQFFGKGGEGEQAIKAGQQFLQAFEEGVNQAGLSIKNKDTSSLSGSIRSITEETADLLASYINAIRADVAVNRMLLTQFVSEYWGAYMQQVTSVNTTLRSIDKNVAALAVMFSETGKIYGMIENISNRLDRFANGVDGIKVQ